MNVPSSKNSYNINCECGDDDAVGVVAARTPISDSSWILFTFFFYFHNFLQYIRMRWTLYKYGCFAVV